MPQQSPTSKLRLPISRIQQLTFNRGLLIAVGTLMSGAALGWTRPPACVIWAVAIIGLLLVLAGLLTLDADPCEERLKRVQANANHLAQQLANFDNWWHALQNDELLDGQPMPRAKAMETLLFRFTRFFAAAWLYEDHCREHPPHDEVVEWLREIYKLLGEPKKGPSDDRIMSQELHAIGEAGTNGWGTVDVRLKSHAEMEDAMHGDVFDPLRRFLGGAGPGTEPLARLEMVRKALERHQD